MIAPEPNQQVLFQTWPENAQIGSKYVVILHFLVHVEPIIGEKCEFQIPQKRRLTHTHSCALSEKT